MGDPLEKLNLSASVDWKLVRNQRKIKIRDLKQTLAHGIADKFKDFNDRTNILDKHGDALSGNQGR